MKVIMTRKSKRKTQRISPCEKDKKVAEKREFEIKGIALINELRQELKKAEKTRLMD